MNNYNLRKKKNEFYHLNKEENEIQKWLQNQEHIEHMRLKAESKFDSNKKEIRGEKYYKVITEKPKDGIYGREPHIDFNSKSIIKYLNEDRANIIPQNNFYDSSNDKDGNLSRQFGAFGEYLVQYILGAYKKFKVARVDHVGADLIATDKKGNYYGISVKSVHDKQFSFKNSDKEKLRTFCNEFYGEKMIPYIALVFCMQVNEMDEIGVYLVNLKYWENTHKQTSITKKILEEDPNVDKLHIKLDQFTNVGWMNCI